MKKKFVLTLALALIVAASLVAAPVTLTGSFKAGYTYTSGTSAITVANTPEINTDGLAITGDFWKVAVASDLFTFGDDNAVKGTGTIYLDKALAAQGTDMGDVTITLAIGNSGTMSGLNVYSDPNGTVGDEGYKVRQKGAYSTSVTVGYGSMVTVNATADPTDKVNKPFGLSAKFAPVDGVSAAVAYTNYAENKWTSTIDADGAIGGSVCVDVAALAGLDFGLKASAIDTYFLGQKENNLLAALSASYGDVSGWTEYQLFDGTSNLKVSASYAGIENVGLSASVTLTDLSNISTKIGAGANYTMGGVKYALDGAYVIDGDFTLTPSVKITF
ncbi:hypothetical protein SpiGrapes_1020 [Sphaerochaeta pleomorpha str. Grapes]|uniref:Porin domain-containing protein n=1 Tax=Sphaerochaeta pleomorpha (strain ATCC BAA-1885 / DSM 22778 / Grapes) TaxID=158190 RepID=G8QRR1_SPHPG|nr:hypothetical protein [Sphaerochaeta pleomorpha]AEV28844.1 hypothetical protein SpiGrapes_1020 [Sphaerochaeta pleomorpha str. Grapes]